MMCNREKYRKRKLLIPTILISLTKASDCLRVDVNSGCVHSPPTKISVDGLSSYVCPTRVDKTNWLTTGEDHVPDVFGIIQEGDSITVGRTDSVGTGWCMSLSFACCVG